MSDQRDKTLLRVVFCGSVDDGKSTLIGRLLADTGNVPSDQLEALAKDSLRFGSAGDAVDYALLVDGLQAEREQGITIDVAYRYFKTDRRSYVVADTPGHVQYTRNMATGASVSEVAVILIDARKGVLQQTRRHTCIAHLFGIRAIVAAVNKMDLVGYDAARFEEVAAEYRAFAVRLGVSTVEVIPVAARDGDNVLSRGTSMPWYDGPSLMETLDTINPHSSRPPQPFRMPVQIVIRPDADHRAYAGTVASGTIHKDDPICIMPSGRMSSVRAISTFDGERMSATVGDAVSLVIADDIDISRGDVIVDPKAPPRVTEHVAAKLVWLDEEPMIQGRQYIFKFGRQSVLGFVSALRHALDIDDLTDKPAHQLAANAIGFCEIELSKRVVVDSYVDNRELGSFIVIDRMSRATVAAGMVQPQPAGAPNLYRQRLDIGKDLRAAALRQRPRCVWFTGLSGAGKSTVANHLEARLHALGRHTYLLDGDNVRHGLNRDLGFSKEDRVENIRRVAEVAKLMVDAGLIVLVAFISPFRAERQMARELFEPGEFIEVFVDTPFEICAERDPKGLYKKAGAGALKDFTGVDQAYEPPLDPEVRLRYAANVSAADFAEQILASHFADLT